jgi:pyridoxamine 5'-phosphate oxidase-like protein
VKLDVGATDLQSLLDAPSPATLTLYREDGSAITSPVWFRVHEDAFEIVVAATDHKLEHLRRDPRCILLIFEAAPPFRGVEVRSEVTVEADEGARSRLAIASRYLGLEAGRAYADSARRPPGFVIRLPLKEAHAWSLADKLPRSLTRDGER